MNFMEDKSNNELDLLRTQSKVFESRFEAIAQTASDSIIISDENSNIIFANKKANNVFGYDQEELLGKNLTMLMPEKYRKGHFDGMKRYIQTKNPKLIGHTIEIEGIKKDGTIFPIELSLSSWMENHQHFFSGIMRDITERKKQYDEIFTLNKKLQEQQIELKAANEELSSLNEELYALNEDVNEGKEEVQSALNKLNILNNVLEQRVEERTHELAKRENQLRLITDALPVLIAYVDAGQRYKFNNLAYEKWFNISKEEVHGKHLKEVLGDEAYGAIKETILKVLSGEAIYLETKLNFKEIGLKHVSINYIPHFHEGEVMGYYALITDISEHKRAQEALILANKEIHLLLKREMDANAEVKTQQRRWYNLLMQAPSLIAILKGKDFVFELANPPFIELFGLNGSIIGKTVKEVAPDLEKELESLLQNVYNGETFISKEYPVFLDWKKEGKPYTKYFNLIYEPIKENDGSISGIITYGYEVTEHVILRANLEKNAWTMKKMNQALKKKNQDLKKLNIDLDNFIYTASHDLKSPAVNLEGLITLLKQEFDQRFEHKDRSLIEMIEKSIHKLYKTILDLTVITKAQKDIDGEVEQVSIKELLEDVKIDLNANIQSSKAIIEECIHVNKIVFNRGNLKSIVFNLISNAIKYRAPERQLIISLSTFKENGATVLCVKDNGLGVEEHQLSKMFTMFKRLHNHVEGTGIGLYIVKRVIENNGGQIHVESKIDMGTTFKVFFPSHKNG
ncbi:MAG: PAS domain S-box protein [Bacteroidota bacterium]|nr:PAS domain S-box protein [Bacteroidota bacterium]